MISALIACSACQFTREPRPSARPAPLVEPAAQGEAEPALGEAIFLVRSRFATQPPLPGDSQRSRCTDEALDRAAATRLPLRLRDVRADRRQLLPLRLSLALTTESAARATRLVDPNQAFDAPGAAAPGRDAREERAAIERLATLRYVSELQIDSYRAPKLFRRKDAPRSEWSPAMLSGRLVVYELSGFKALCQAPISVIVSGDGESIRRRLRDTVRKKMTLELERRVRDELERALAGISGAFSLEPSPTAAQPLLLAGLEP